MPCASVTATQGDKTVVAITDAQGIYSFPNLPDGSWTLQIEMQCFQTIKQEIKIASNVPFSPQWDLKLLPFDEIKASAPPPPPMPAAQPAAQPGATTAANGASGPAPPAEAPKVAS